MKYQKPNIILPKSLKRKDQMLLINEATTLSKSLFSLSHSLPLPHPKAANKRNFRSRPLASHRVGWGTVLIVGPILTQCRALTLPCIIARVGASPGLRKGRVSIFIVRDRFAEENTLLLMFPVLDFITIGYVCIVSLFFFVSRTNEGGKR